MLKTMNEVEGFFESRKTHGIKPGLNRVHFLLHKLGNPEKDLCAVHVAGTNGKGSTIQFLHDALVANEYNVGVFTSPSFTGIRGHILVNGKEICERDFIDSINQLLPYIKQLDVQEDYPTEFEVMTVIALMHFSKQTDIALIETGMGGKEDTTNVILPAISVITNVSMDHMQFLGESIEAITRHKAGIIKRNQPVVIGKVSFESRQIIQAYARDQSAPLYELHQDFDYEVKENKTYKWIMQDVSPLTFNLQMAGAHQVDNAAVAMMVLHLLEKEQGIEINWLQVSQRIETTQLKGRFEQVSEKPTIILDSAHNIAGIEAFIHTVQTLYKDERKQLLFAGFKDKQLKEMLEQLTNSFEKLTLTTFVNERAAHIDELKELAAQHKLDISESWEEKISEIMKHTETDEIFFITGSLHFIIQVRTFMKANY